MPRQKTSFGTVHRSVPLDVGGNKGIEIRALLIHTLIRHEQLVDIIGAEAAMAGSTDGISGQKALLPEAVDAANAHTKAVSSFCSGEEGHSFRRNCRSFNSAQVRLGDATRHGDKPENEAPSNWCWDFVPASPSAAPMEVESFSVRRRQSEVRATRGSEPSNCTRPGHQARPHGDIECLETRYQWRVGLCKSFVGRRRPMASPGGPCQPLRCSRRSLASSIAKPMANPRRRPAKNPAIPSPLLTDLDTTEKAGLLWL